MWKIFIGSFKKVLYSPAKMSDNKDILNTANAFTKACEIFVYKFINDRKTMPIVPMITNMAFAIELYLKYLLTKNNIDLPKGNNGHNFEVLIDSLPQKIKEELIQKICLSYNEINSSNFNAKIEPIKKCFSDWRYIYEVRSQKGIDLELLVSLMLSLRNICMKIK